MRVIRMRFSCLLPVHNERKFLPYSLPSVFALQPDEIIVMLDRCSDNSHSVALKIKETLNYEGTFVLVPVESMEENWNSPLFYVMYEGTKIAKNDVILTIGADTQFGKIVGKHMKVFEDDKVGWVSFSFRDYPFKYSTWVASKIQKIYTRRTPRGINYAFRKSIVMDKVDKMKSLTTGIDTFIFEESRKKGHKNLFYQSDTIHLRPRGVSRDYKLGVRKYDSYKESITEVLFNSLLYLRPLQIAGYLKARLRKEPIRRQKT